MKGLSEETLQLFRKWGYCTEKAAAKTNALKTGSFNPDVLEKGLSEMQKIFEELGI